MFFLLSQSALALTCDAGDTLCDDVNTMQGFANAEFNGAPITDAVATNFLNNLRGADDALFAASCTVDGFLAGKWAGKAGTLSGDSSGGGGVSGSLGGGSFQGTMDGGSTTFGDAFDAIHHKSRRVVANIGDNGLIAGMYVRTSGRRGAFMALSASCPGAPADAIGPWFPGNLDDWDTGGGPLTFDFRTDPATSYVRVDRMGMPAVNTAVIIGNTNKDFYNQLNPSDDGTFPAITSPLVGDVVASIDFLHGALRDDLFGAGLTTCSSPPDGTPTGYDITECINQAGPLVFPDTLKIDPAATAGFPNGRKLMDPAVDVTLAALLLDVDILGLSTGPHAATALVGVSQTGNDVAFGGSFPFVAPAH